jgi:hypothetical protein
MPKIYPDARLAYRQAACSFLNTDLDQAHRNAIRELKAFGFPDIQVTRYRGGIDWNHANEIICNLIALKRPEKPEQTEELCRLLTAYKDRLSSHLTYFGCFSHNQSRNVCDALHNCILWMRRDLSKDVLFLRGEYVLEPIKGEENAEAFRLWLLRAIGSLGVSDELDADNEGVQALTDLLDAIPHDPELRAECFDTAEDAASTCGDGIQVNFQHMREALLSYCARNGTKSLEDLQQLGRGLFRSNLVTEILLRDFPDNTDPKQLDAMVKYELHKPLNLPVRIAKPLFIDPVRITSRRVLAEVLKIESEGRFVDWLAEWEPWKVALRARYPVEFASVAAPYEEREATLFDARRELNDAVYENEMQRTKKDRDCELSDLIKVLTQREMLPLNIATGSKSGQGRFDSNRGWVSRGAL